METLKLRQDNYSRCWITTINVEFLANEIINFKIKLSETVIISQTNLLTEK